MGCESRYADINYQLRRPDVLANKVVALKFLALPMTLIPGVLLGSLAVSAWWAQEERLFRAALDPFEPPFWFNFELRDGV